MEIYTRLYRPWHNILVVVNQYRQVKGNRLVQSSKVQVQAMLAKEICIQQMDFYEF